MKKSIIFLALALTVLTTSGCVQQSLVIPVTTISGKVIVPPGSVPTGVKISIVGEKDSTYVNESGEYSFELRKSGRFLLVGRGRDFDANFVWVDSVLEEEVSAPDLVLDEKIVGEALFIASVLDFDDEPIEINLVPSDPEWEEESYKLYDDGTHGDKVANDGVFARRFTNLRTGSQLYEFEIVYGENDSKNKSDPHAEGKRNGKSEIIIPDSTVKLARGYITSDLTGVNYSEVTLATKKGSRAVSVDSDGGYRISMEGNGKEYLVFRSSNFHVRAIAVDLSTVPLYEVPTSTLTSKKSGEIKVILIKSDFAQVTDPAVVGDFTKWQPMQLYDDATHGDEFAGDGVYTREFTGVAPGYHKYAFNITSESQVKDPYQESGDSQYSIIQVK